MLTAVYTILVFCIIIFVHEFGHFAVSKMTGMTVHEFSIGMGPTLFSYDSKKTKYSVRLLPIGGFVRLEGEDEKSDDINAFCNKKPWQRLGVLFAGAFMNFVLGFVIFGIIFSTTAPITSNIIGEVVKDSAFYDEGILVGDEIVRMEGKNFSSRIRCYNDVSHFVSRNGDTKCTITFRRGDKKFTKTIEPKFNENVQKKIFGFAPQIQKPTLINVVKAAYNQSVFVIKIVIGSFADLVAGRVSLSDMSGPVGIVSEINNAAKEGMANGILAGILNVSSLAALISINLGVVNLLPLPALDGGRIFFIILELLRRKPIDKQKEGFVHFVGFALLMLLMIAVTFFDLEKLF